MRGCLVGVAIGDAIGVPWEMCSAEEILDLTDGKGVTGLQDLPGGRERKFEDLRGLKLGDTSDDWQLTKAVASSILRAGGVDVFSLALAHVEAYEASTAGWGGSTRDAVAEMKTWFDSRGRKGRSPDVPPEARPKRGAGNGVIMKMSPVVLLSRLLSIHNPSEDWLATAITMLSRLTHPDEKAIRAAKFTAHTLEDIVANFWRHPCTRDDALRDLKRAHNRSAMTIEPLDRVLGKPMDVRDEILASAQRVREATGTSCYAPETTAFTFCTFLRHPTDFRAAILEAVNAGGDTDTNASIVGSLVGANVGLSGIPQEWFDPITNPIPSVRDAIGIADALFDAFGGASV